MGRTEYDETRDFGAAVNLKSDILSVIERDTLIDARSEDLVALAKGLAGLGWRNAAVKN